MSITTRIGLFAMTVLAPAIALAAPGKSGPQSGSFQDMLAWFSARPSVAFALVLGVSALIAGIVLNRDRSPKAN